MTTTVPARPLDLGSSQWLGLFFAVLGAELFATKGIIIKLALADGVDTLTTLTWRMIVAVPVFLTVGFLAYRRRDAARPAGAPPLIRPSVLLRTLGVGVLGYYVASFLDFSGLDYITAQLDRLILLTYPFFVVLFGAVFFKRKVTRLMIAAQLVSYAGIAVIFMRDFSVEGRDVVLGVTLVGLSALVYAAYQILAKPLIDDIGADLFTSIAMSAAGPAVVIHFLATHAVSALAVPQSAWWLMFAIGTIATVAPAYCISAAIGRIGPERTAVVGNVSPPVTVGLAIVVLNEAFTLEHAIGTALVLVGVVLFTRRAKAKRPIADVEP